MPWNPPSGSYRFLSVPTLWLLPALVGTMTAGFAGDLAAGAYLLLAEILAVIGTAAEVALERHSRSRVLAIAEAKDDVARVERHLGHTPTYEITARLMRFLGNAMLVTGIAYLAFREHFDADHADAAGVPWSTFVTLSL